MCVHFNTFEIVTQNIKYTDMRINPKKSLALTSISNPFRSDFLWFVEEQDQYLRYNDITGKKRTCRLDVTISFACHHHKD